MIESSSPTAALLVTHEVVLLDLNGLLGGLVLVLIERMSRLWKPPSARVEDLVLADGTPADDGDFPDVISHADRRVIRSELLADVSSAARSGRSPAAANAGAGKAIRRLPYPDSAIDDVPAARWLELLHEEEIRRKRRLAFDPPSSMHHAREAGKPWRRAGEVDV